MSDRAAVFIDGGYFDKVCESLDRLRPDYERFSEKVCRQTERLRTYYYHCYPYQGSPPTLEERSRHASMDRFAHSLRMLRRFEVRLGRMQVVDGTYRQKGIDTLLSIDLVELASTGQIGKAVLVTGDSDFVPAVGRAKDKGVIVDLFYGSTTHVHADLLEVCDDRVPLPRSFFDDCLRPERTRPPRNLDEDTANRRA